MMSTPPVAFPEPDNDSDKDSNSSPSGTPKRSRLDREIDDILTQSTKTNPLPPIPFKQRVSEKRRATPAPSPSTPQLPMRDFAKILTAYPILTSLAFAILCSMVGDASPLLARLFALAAVVALVYPIVVSVRGGSGDAGPKLWRGQVIDIHQSPSSPVEQVKRWFRSRPPR